MVVSELYVKIKRRERTKCGTETSGGCALISSLEEVDLPLPLPSRCSGGGDESAFQPGRTLLPLLNTWYELVHVDSTA